MRDEIIRPRGDGIHFGRSDKTAERVGFCLQSTGQRNQLVLNGPAMTVRHGGDSDQGSIAIPTTGSPPPTVPRDLATPVFRSIVTQRLAALPPLFNAAKATSLKT